MINILNFLKLYKKIITTIVVIAIIVIISLFTINKIYNKKRLLEKQKADFIINKIIINSNPDSLKIYEIKIKYYDSLINENEKSFNNFIYINSMSPDSIAKQVSNWRK